MSRTTLNPRTGRLYTSFPADNGACPSLLGDLLHVKGVHCPKARFSREHIFPYSGSPVFCLRVAKALAHVTPAEAKNHLRRMGYAYENGTVVADILNKCKRWSLYFRRLADGFIEVNSIPTKNGKFVLPAKVSSWKKQS